MLSLLYIVFILILRFNILPANKSKISFVNSQLIKLFEQSFFRDLVAFFCYTIKEFYRFGDT